MSLLLNLFAEFETAASNYALTGKSVLTTRTHVDTGLLRRSMRVESSIEGDVLVGRVITQFYGPILDARSANIKKTPPGPMAEGWIQETVREANREFRRDFSIAKIVERAVVRTLNQP